MTAAIFLHCGLRPCRRWVRHVWQSTLFAFMAGIMTLFLRRNQARARYWLWMAASVKFLIPFSWLVALGSSFGWPLSNGGARPAFIR